MYLPTYSRVKACSWSFTDIASWSVFTEDDADVMKYLVEMMETDAGWDEDLNAGFNKRKGIGTMGRA